ncbi:hypothetical protein LIHA111178_08195 [Litorimonas haliclonae]
MSYLRKSKRPIHTIIVHSSATKANRKVSKADLHQWHVVEQGWTDVGYHGFIHRDGSFESLRPVDRNGAHASGHNTNTLGIMMVGGLSESHGPEANFTKAQFSTLRKVLEEQLVHYPSAKIIGHRDTKATACPSFDVKYWWETGEVLP